MVDRVNRRLRLAPWTSGAPVNPARLLGPALALTALLGTAALARTLPPPDPEPDPLHLALQAELTRAWELLQAQPEPPYWLQVAVMDRRMRSIQATHGATGTWRDDRGRIGDVDLRVGSPELDNTRKIRDAGWFSDVPRARFEVPIEDQGGAIQLGLWRGIDDSYRGAVRQLIRVRANDAVKVESRDSSADFSPSPPQVELRAVPSVELDPQAWTDLVREASAVFLSYPDVHDSNVSFAAEDQVRHILSSEGTRLRLPQSFVRLSISASTTAEDGMRLDVYDYVDGASPGAMPDREKTLAMAHAVAQRVTDLRKAPIVDPYVGPAILRGRAAAVFFHEVLGHRVEGHRQKDEDEGQTFTDKVGQPVLPAFLDVVDDPTLARVGGVDLNGHYRYDDEGVAAQRVSVVEAGILRGFLMSRSPIQGFGTSNGHARRQPGAAPVARQGNLIISARQSVSYTELRRQLIAQVRAQGRPFGLVFDDITGGFTFTGRVTPNAFNVQPVSVWKVFPDGRPDELVRGVDLIGTPLTTFERILAASDQVDVFNGSCGAESGWVPVAAVAPDLLVAEVEVQRKEKAHDRPPLLPPPLPATTKAEVR